MKTLKLKLLSLLAFGLFFAGSLSAGTIYVFVHGKSSVTVPAATQPNTG
ncbi:MAG: hypothetical protein H7A25_18315 [Leptospiraceae bacterium]|nr:hypothetical protein [Leptospiraceae bacterium]MCP5501863.1 hypothetical protein [Leptospiraceae bacterium]